MNEKIHEQKLELETLKEKSKDLERVDQYKAEIEELKARLRDYNELGSPLATDSRLTTLGSRDSSSKLAIKSREKSKPSIYLPKNEGSNDLISLKKSSKDNIATSVEKWGTFNSKVESPKRRTSIKLKESAIAKLKEEKGPSEFKKSRNVDTNSKAATSKTGNSIVFVCLFT